MKQIISLITATAIATSAFGTEVVYDRASAAKTKEIYLLSQTLPEGSELGIKVNGRTRDGGRGMFSFGENTDPLWEGYYGYTAYVRHCADERVMDAIRANYTIKSYVGDARLVGLRSAVSYLRDKGAKYIVIHDHLGFPAAKGRMALVDADEYLAKYIEQNGNGTKYGIASSCSGESAGSWLGILGQVTAIGLGVAGAKLGSTSMTSLATNANVAIVSATQSNGEPQAKEVPGTFGAEVSDGISGMIDPMAWDDAIQKRPAPDWMKNLPKYEPHRVAMPIADVEAFLGKFMEIKFREKNCPSDSSYCRFD